MRNRIGRLAGLSGVLAMTVGAGESVLAAADRLATVTLMKNEVLSARLRVLRVASAADVDWMVLEIENLTSGPLTIGQAWLGIDAERRDLTTDKRLSFGSLDPGVVFRGVVQPGVVRVSSEVWPVVSAILGHEPKRGVKVVAKARIQFMMKDRHFDSPAREFEFLWRYPDAAEIAGMKVRARELLRNPRYDFAHGYELDAVFAIPEATEDLTAEELLSAVKSRVNSVDGRDLIARELGKRYPGDPRTVAYFCEELKKGKTDDVSWPGIWNRAYVPILVEDFEETGDRSTLVWLLGEHRADWSSDGEVVARLSAALVKHRPLLSREVSGLGTDELFAWGECAHEAGVVGDRGLIKYLAPGLDDTRMAIHPQEELLAFPPGRERVCDHALEAIASILGISLSKEYGVRYGMNGLEPGESCDRAIAEVKKRLAALELKANPNQ